MTRLKQTPKLSSALLGVAPRTIKGKIITSNTYRSAFIASAIYRSLCITIYPFRSDNPRSKAKYTNSHILFEI